MTDLAPQNTEPRRKELPRWKRAAQVLPHAQTVGGAGRNLKFLKSHTLSTLALLRKHHHLSAEGHARLVDLTTMTFRLASMLDDYYRRDVPDTETHRLVASVRDPFEGDAEFDDDEEAPGSGSGWRPSEGALLTTDLDDK
jgi:hypothetical protein